MKAAAIIISLLGTLTLFLWGLGGALIPLLISFALAYLVFPLVKKCEARGVNRSLAVGLVFSAFVIVIGVLSALVIPELISDAKHFSRELPALSLKASARVELLARKFGVELTLTQSSVRDYIESHMSELSTGVAKSFGQGIRKAFSGIARWIIAILNLLLIPLFFFYVINDYEKIVGQIKSLIPPAIQPRLRHYQSLSNEVLSGYIRGQLMVACLLGVLYALGLWAIGLRFGILIGVLSGLMSVIPYAGFSLGFLSALMIGFANFTGWGPILGIAAVFGVVQALESMLITPKLVGDKVGLSALITMLALIIGGNLLGMVGMLMAIPVAAILKSLLSDLANEYRELIS